MVPYSLAASLIFEANLSPISVGKGPSPTLVEYAFIIPKAALIFHGAYSLPLEVVPETDGDEEVTYG